MANRILLKEGGYTGSIPRGYKSIGIINNQFTIGNEVSTPVDTYLSNVTLSGTNLNFTSTGYGFTGTVSLPLVGGTSDSFLNIGSSSNNSTINWALANSQEIILDSDVNLNFQNPSVGIDYTLHVKETGRNFITWPGNIIWKNFTQPSIRNKSYFLDKRFNTSGSYVTQLQPDGTLFLGQFGKFSKEGVIISGFTTSNLGDVRCSKTTNDGFIFIGRTGAPRLDKIISSSGLIVASSSFSVEGTGFNSRICTIDTQTDGKIICGGLITSFNGITGRIFRLNSNGTRDISFTTNFNGNVLCIKVQSDGKIICGGEFTQVIIDSVSTTVGRIIRLNSNGTLDDTFNVGGVGFNGTVGGGQAGDSNRSIVIQPDGKILISGQFTTYNGSSFNRIIRLNSDGSVDSSFQIGTGFDSGAGSGSISCLSLKSDGKILCSGGFTTYNSVSARFAVLLNSDGTRDNKFWIGTGFGLSTISAATNMPTPPSNGSFGKSESCDIDEDGNLYISGIDISLYDRYVLNNNQNSGIKCSKLYYSDTYLRLQFTWNGTNYIGTY